MIERRCKNCRWWADLQKPETPLSETRGRCHGAPPQIFSTYHDIGRFPITSESAWCSLFSPRLDGQTSLDFMPGDRP